MPREIPIAVVGSYADLGGEIVVTAEWSPDPDAVAAELVQLAGYLENVERPLMAAKAIAQADVRHHFDTETAPSGEKWAPLDPEYLTKKTAMGGDTRILRRYGDLEDAATSGSAFIVEGHDLFYSADGLPFYWRWMQDGTGPGGSRALGYSLRVEKARKAGREFTGTSHEGQGIGRGQDTPARPFVGLSAEAEEQIFEVFDLWFAEGVKIAIGSTGTVQERVSGRFGRKLYPDF